MVARILDCEVKLEKKDDFVTVVKNEVLPLLKKQTGFLALLLFFPDQMKDAKLISISLWRTKADAERYGREFYPRVLEILKSFLIAPVRADYYRLETTLCENVVEALRA
ncbi:MAG: hypothetical protein WAL05_15410 [Candidatus Sulfotelmatobacter sp.]